MEARRGVDCFKQKKQTQKQYEGNKQNAPKNCELSERKGRGGTEEKREEGKPSAKKRVNASFGLAVAVYLRICKNTNKCKGNVGGVCVT
jgi:hypothetical protein